MQYDTNRQPARPQAAPTRTLPTPTTSQAIYAGGGVLIGLILGLLIAWVVWPVQWTSAWPADLSQEARAQYLAAVAEAYVYYGDAQAAEVARNRLFNLNEDLEGYLVEAQRFFVDNPQASSRVYISNLGQLAQALNIQSPDIIIDTPVDGVAAVETPLDNEGGEVGDSVRAWVNWALTVLAAIILVGGGFYVVGRLNQRRLATSEADTLDDGGFDDEPGGSGFVRPVPAQTSGYARPLRGAPSGVAMPTAVPTRGTSQRQNEDFGGFDDGFDGESDEEYSEGFSAGFNAGFNDEVDDDPYARTSRARALDYRSEDEIFDDPLDDDLLDNEALDDDLIDETPSQRRGEPHAIYAPRRQVESFDTLDDNLPDNNLPDDDLDDIDDLDDDLPEGYALVPGETIAAEPAAVATPPSVGRTTPGIRTLNTYNFQYHAGIADYDQSRPIVDPTTGLQVGDCGMGVNVKNNSVQNNPDNVVALDVWLVDKKQEKSFSSQDRVLLSEYVVDHNLETNFTRDRPNDPSPIIPQPGTTFQIKGPSLTLDCVITEVVYMKSGPSKGMFQSLSIDMTVRSRG